MISPKWILKTLNSDSINNFIMKLAEVIQLDEEKIIAALKSGNSTAIYKNPTKDELDAVAFNGIVKGILTPENFIAYDFQNVDRRQLPPLHGYPVVLYFGRGTEITIELFHGIGLSQESFEKIVDRNTYLKRFTIKKILVPQ